MNRREFLYGCAAGVSLSRLQQPASVVPQLKIDAYSRHLQWLRTPEEIAIAVKEMGYDGLDLTVRPYPGHVSPDKVAQDLPPFVNGLRKNGVDVHVVTAPIVDADSPNAEQILKTASELGIRYYWWGTFRYQEGVPLTVQLDALRPRAAKLAQLSAKYKMSAMYHTYANGAVGSTIWDMLYVLKDLDPAVVGLHFDTGHMSVAGPTGNWAVGLRAAGPYVRGLSVKDSVLEKTSGGWVVRQVPLGQGMVQLPQLTAILKEIKFNGPIEIQAEYPNGGANNAADKITLPPEQVLGAMKHDQEMLRTALREAGLV
jgi:sugar phosphate isomerase/epimerase